MLITRRIVRIIFIFCITNHRKLLAEIWCTSLSWCEGCFVKIWWIYLGCFPRSQRSPSAVVIEHSESVSKALLVISLTVVEVLARSWWIFVCGQKECMRTHPESLKWFHPAVSCWQRINRFVTHFSRIFSRNLLLKFFTFQCNYSQVLNYWRIRWT